MPTPQEVLEYARAVLGGDTAFNSQKYMALLRELDVLIDLFAKADRQLALGAHGEPILLTPKDAPRHLALSPLERYVLPWQPMRAGYATATDPEPSKENHV